MGFAYYPTAQLYHLATYAKSPLPVPCQDLVQMSYGIRLLQQQKKPIHQQITKAAQLSFFVAISLPGKAEDRILTHASTKVLLRCKNPPFRGCYSPLQNLCQEKKRGKNAQATQNGGRSAVELVEGFCQSNQHTFFWQERGAEGSLG